MKQGIRSIIYPVSDIARAKTQFTTLLGAVPYTDSASYVGYKLGDIDIGLDPNGHKAGTTVYYHVADIKQSLQSSRGRGRTNRAGYHRYRSRRADRKCKRRRGQPHRNYAVGMSASNIAFSTQDKPPLF